MSDDDPVAGVRGERRNLSIGVVSTDSRLSNALALGLMSLLGLGSLTWYYAHAIMRQDRSRKEAQTASTQRAQGDAPLPSLGRIAPPPPDQDRQGDGRTLPEIVLSNAPPATATTPAAGANPAKSPEELALERQLSGAVFATPTSASAAGAGPGLGSDAPHGVPADGPGRSGDLATLLRPSPISAVTARRLPARRLLLPKGAFVDCTLETAIDSTLPGMTTCVTATDTFSADGAVVLLERGTKLIGETRGQVQQGSARIFVLWTEARTPEGVVVPLDSPGTDELGRAGLAGTVNRHFWQRFGAAMLVSLVDGAAQAAVQSSRNTSGEVIVNPSGSQEVLTEILKNTIGIAPTVTKRNGDRIQVLVARDVDFGSVYELRSASAGR